MTIDNKTLIKALRVCGDDNGSCADCPIDCPGFGEWEFAASALMRMAADVIEQLMNGKGE